MGMTISARLEADAARALAELEATGMTRSQAVREALQAAARRLRDPLRSPRKPGRWRGTRTTWLRRPPSAR